MNNQKSYYAIIPADVRYSSIPPNAKLLYGEITALSNEKGYCWASNKYFADLYKVKTPTISSWIQKLRDNGFISYEVKNNNTRQIYLKGVSENPEGGIRKNRWGVSENPEHNSTVNTTSNTTKNCEETSQDKTSKKDISLSTDIAEILEAFKIVNPSYKKYYGNTTQRASAERMILEHGKKLILNTIGYLPKSNAQKYAPTITTAWQLEENLGKLKAWADKIKSNKPHVLI